MSEVILFDPVRRERAMRSRDARLRRDRLFLAACVATAFLSVAILFVLLAAIIWQGIWFLDWAFITSLPHDEPSKAGILPALMGTLYIGLICAACTLPIGVATAIFLEEFKPRRRWLKRFHGFVQLNISNLAGVPSVVYGIIGLTVFVTMFGLAGEPGESAYEFGVSYSMQMRTLGRRIVLIPVAGPHDKPALTDGLRAYTPDGDPVELNVLPPGAPVPRDPALRDVTLRANARGGVIPHRSWYYTRLPFGSGILAGGLTLMLVVLPILIIASQEALRAVPNSLRDGALGLGATRWQTIRRVTLPAAIPGIMTGSIISMSRAIGEAAPVLMIAGTIYITSVPRNLMDDFTVMPLQIYNWANRPYNVDEAGASFHALAASGILVLLAVLLTFNSVAVLIRHKLQKPLS